MSDRATLEEVERVVVMIKKPNIQQIREFLDRKDLEPSSVRLAKCYLETCVDYIEGLTRGVETTLDTPFVESKRGECRASAYAINQEYRARYHRDASACRLVLAEWLEGGVGQP